MAKTPLRVSKIKEIRLKSVEGSAVLEKYSLLVQLLEREISGKPPLLLAEPEINQTTGELKWHPPIPGTPVPLEELPPDERERAEKTLEERLADFKDLALKLKASPSSNRAYAGKCVEGILETRASFKLFWVDGRLVAAGWGTDELQAGSESMPAELTEGAGPFVSAPTLPRVQAPAVPAPAGFMAAAAAPALAGAFPWWILWTLLLLLLPLLLLLLILFLLKLLPFQVPAPAFDPSGAGSLWGKLYEIRMEYDGKLGACVLPDRAEAAPLPGRELAIPERDLPDKDPPEADGVVREIPGQGGALYGGTDPFDPAYAGTLPDGTLPDGTLPDGTLPVGPVVDENLPVDERPPEGDLPPEAGLLPEDGTLPDKGPTPDEKNPPPDDGAIQDDGRLQDDGNSPRENRPEENPQNQPGANPADGNRTPEGGEASRPGADKPGEGAPLTMPEAGAQGAQGDMPWLKGCWNSSSRFSSSNTGEEIEYYYCFDEKGKANIYANIKDKGGRIIDTCRSGADAKLENGSLTVKSQTAAVCSDGVRNFVPSSVVCEPGETEAKCRLRQEGVDREMNTRFTKRE
ncbi:MAG: hypothetical protein LBR53_04950 [Deltaproteobacteria bacterium]|jgi:hypothetical protein|nr:hypothetical protein [Deltaproteobacteria bacterium]